MRDHKHPTALRYTLRVLAHLLRYPNAELKLHLEEMRQALHDETVLGPARLAELDRLITRLATRPLMQLEAEYVELFDRGRGTALHLFEHVHGDSRERGPAMLALGQSYAEAGLLLAEGELPDYLPVWLEFTSTQPAAQARRLLGEVAHILQRIFSALQARRSAYAALPGALLDLAGVQAERVALPEEPELDESWSEPPAFDGCSSAGQARPGQPQPIHVMRPSGSPGAHNAAHRRA